MNVLSPKSPANVAYIFSQATKFDSCPAQKNMGMKEGIYDFEKKTPVISMKGENSHSAETVPTKQSWKWNTNWNINVVVCVIST